MSINSGVRWRVKAMVSAAKFAFSSPSRMLRKNPRDISAWLKLIDDANRGGKLSPHAQALVKSHELTRYGHAVNAFADAIADKGGATFDRIGKAPANHLDEAVEELVRWKTAVQCGHSHDVSKGYFRDAEATIQTQWDGWIYPLIKDFDFSVVLDLACGHGRNTEYLKKLSPELHLVDINKSCIDACKERFTGREDGSRFFYYVNSGNSLSAISSDSISLVYCWDSMVHFDKLVVRDYVAEIKRILKPGGVAFLHHSNLGDTQPDTDWAKNDGTRSDMSGTIMREYAQSVGLEVVSQHIQGRAEGWGTDGMDCVSILKKSGLRGA